MKLDDRADKLGKYSPQCDLCTKEEGIWLCSFYGDTPDEYWLDKKKCPEFSSTKVKEYVLGKMKGGAGSGFFARDGHVGIQGHQGGSAREGSGISSMIGDKKVISQDAPGGRASGGVTTIGINQGTYRGGQFLPSTQLDKMSNARKKKIATYMDRKQEIEPNKFEKPPAENMSSINRRLSGIVPWKGGKYHVELMTKTSYDMFGGAELKRLSELYNNGERWFENNELTHLK